MLYVKADREWQHKLFAFRVLGAFPRAVTCIDAKKASLLIHHVLTNGHITPVRGVALGFREP